MSKQVESVMRQCIRMEVRKGNILVLTAMMMVVMAAFMAFAVDLGYLYTVRTELQAAADAAALAAAGAMYESPNSLETSVYYQPPDPHDTRAVASDYVKKNGAGGYRGGGTNDEYLRVNWNSDNDPDGDIVIGRLNVPSDFSESLTPTETTPNSVRVRIPMNDAHLNGSVPLFFAPVLRIFTANLAAEAVATVEFPTLLPLTTSEDKWDSLSSGGDGDNYAYNPGNITSEPDGVSEIQIFPDNHWDGNGMPPGNFGALEFGGVEGTDILRRQIDMGPNEAEVAYHGGTFESEMVISGKTGVNGDIKTAFVGGNADYRVYAGILGKTRYIPIYSDVTGNGSNSQFTISQFVAVRVMAVKMTGNPKWIMLQPVTQRSDLVNLHITR